MSSNAVNFIRKHPLMETSASPAGQRPSLTTVGSKHRLTAIAVDPQVQGIAAEAVDVIYVGTEDGRVIKFFNKESSDTTTTKPVIISDVQVLPPGTRITELTISKASDALIVVSNGVIVTTSLSYCSTMKSCDECARVPGCAWNRETVECVRHVMVDLKRAKNYLQDEKQCPSRAQGGASRKTESAAPPSRGTVAGVGHIPHTGFPADNEITVTSINDRDLPILTNDPGQEWDPSADNYEANQLNTYTAQTMASSVILTSVASLVVGLVVGLYLSRRRCQNKWIGVEERNMW